MTDHDAERAALDAHDPGKHERETELHFGAGFAAGLAHARAWRPLTDDPATWPEERRWVCTIKPGDARVSGPLPWPGGDVERIRSALALLGWTHWLPLPDPPKESKP